MKKHIERIQDWIDYSISHSSWESHYDLHIDMIDDSFKDKSSWVDGGLYAFSLLLKLIDNSRYDALLAMVLNYTRSKTDLGKIDMEYLQNNQYVSPPSLYIFPKSYNEYKKTLDSAIYIDDLSERIDKDVYIYEEAEDVEDIDFNDNNLLTFRNSKTHIEYYRVVYITTQN